MICVRRTATVLAGLLATVLLGRVTDITTGQPLPGVKIAVGSHRTKTDAHGRYRLEGLAPGHYTLTASSSDVPPQHESVDVEGAQTTLDLSLCSTTLDYSCAGAGPGPG
ncbi:MAG TPA: carboxypeptidase-like regulatory domain-containing protein [Verrucomicrobiae bacterium]|nr:carboxypeptidase-like regulatory domain-containing protein [Verrucomicrobiae bacterium]